jgi:hypothetical protein
MKFGLNFHRHRVPEWASFYIDYNAFKRSIKLVNERATSTLPTGELRQASDPLTSTTFA